MGRTYENIEDGIAAFIDRQPMFFVATAPRDDDGHVNLSPKGVPDAFVVVDRSTVAYLDLTGSGIETIAHVRQNGRITLMFCAFEGPPRIVRLYGRGRVISRADEGFDGMAARFPKMPGARAVIIVDVTRVADSCGYGVPHMALVGPREQLWDSFRRKGGDEGLVDYRLEKNALSIDGLPGPSATEAGP